MKALANFLILYFSVAYGTQDNSLYKEVFKNLAVVKSLSIEDPISDKPINNSVFIVKDSSEKLIGFIREVNTTTGCDSACLPVIFTLFYDQNLSLIKLNSRPGLTKKFHRPFTQKDYEKLNLILMINPSIFKNIKHPTEMVDAISGATLKEYSDVVVKMAAYTSLRVNSYHQQTVSELKKIKAQLIGP